MQPLYTQDQYDNSKYSDKLPLKCEMCGEDFLKNKKVLQDAINGRKGTAQYCSRTCCQKAKQGVVSTSCNQCGKKFETDKSQFKKSLNHFCGSSCSATYNNQRKKHGTRRSKLEVWLEQQLPTLYPSIEFHFNRKDAINSELDIYIPSMKLAFELNGIFHYEPIYGAKKLAQIQNNDQRKYQACIEREIEMCLIDASTFSYFKISGAEKYLNIIRSVIDQKLCGE